MRQKSFRQVQIKREKRYNLLERQSKGRMSGRKSSSFCLNLYEVNCARCGLAQKINRLFVRLVIKNALTFTGCYAMGCYAIITKEKETKRFTFCSR